MPPCCPSWILLCRTMGQLLVRIWIPAKALPWMSLLSIKPRPSPNMYTPPWLPLNIAFPLKWINQILLNNLEFNRFSIFHCLFPQFIILPYRWVTVGRDPHTGKIIRIDFVLYKLAPPLLVDIDASCLAVVDLTTDHCGVGVSFHLKACYAISMDVTVLKVALKARKDNKWVNLWCLHRKM